MSVADLKEQIVELRQLCTELDAENAYLRKGWEAFWSGIMPDQGSLQHVIMAQYGRERLKNMRKQPALLVKQASNIDKSQ